MTTTDINDVAKLSRLGDIAVLALDSPPVNALSARLRDGIKGGIDQALADKDVRAIVLICRGKTFVAGADITEFGKPRTGTPLPDLVDLIENSPKPVVAAIHGTALGGGLELALACHYRVAVPSAKVGLPEVKLGLIPGSGGTQRLPRLVGVQKALELITSGAQVAAPVAEGLGIVDKVVPEASLEDAAIAFARDLLAAGASHPRVRDRDDKIGPARGKPEIFAEFRKANARAFRGFPAPEYCIRAIEAAVEQPFDDAVKYERSLFLELVAGSQSAAQRHVFFAERQAWKVPDIADD
ncbi:MAG: enoyl-CoA hydratase-related protein, partial [Ferrovibrionaceae bacterium]